MTEVHIVMYWCDNDPVICGAFSTKEEADDWVSRASNHYKEYRNATCYWVESVPLGARFDPAINPERFED